MNRDTLLLRSGSWSRRIEVTRTNAGDEISINLISSEYGVWGSITFLYIYPALILIGQVFVLFWCYVVGLDIQQKFSAFYSGAKMFRAESYGGESKGFMGSTNETPQRTSIPDKHAKAQATVQRNQLKAANTGMWTHLLVWHISIFIGLFCINPEWLHSEAEI